MLLVVGAIGAAIAATLYMYASFTQRDKYREVAWRIVWDVVFAFAIILALSYPLADLSSEIARGMDPAGASAYCLPRASPDFCAVDIARGYFQSLSIESIGAMRAMLKYYAIVKTVETAGVSVSAQQRQSDYKPFQGQTSFFLLLMENLMEYLKIVVVVSSMQLFLFEFFTNPSVFISLVVFSSLFRIFPPTKKVGGVLLSVALVMFFFFPVLVSIADAAYFAMPVDSNSNMRLNRFFSSGLLDFGVSAPSLGVSGPVLPPSQDAGFDPSTIDNRLEELDRNTEPLDYGNAAAPTSPPPDVNDELVTRITAMETLTLVLAPMIPAFAYTAAYSVSYNIGAVALGWLVPDEALGKAAAVAGWATAGLTAGGAVALIGNSVLLAYSVMLSATEVVASIAVFSAFFSYAILVATIGAIKSLSQFLGGDVEIAGLSKFI